MPLRPHEEITAGFIAGCAVRLLALSLARSRVPADRPTDCVRALIHVRLRLDDVHGVTREGILKKCAR